MQRKKGTFITFIFSLFPGAGEMYLGFMKKGLSIMFIFFSTIAVSSLLGLDIILLILPMIWFYSFFSVHNIKGLPDEEFYALKDDYIMSDSMFSISRRHPEKKYNKIAAVILIVLGLSMLWNNVTDVVLYFLPGVISDIFWRFQNIVPRTVISLLFILGGAFLINGKKKQLDQPDTHTKELLLEFEEKQEEEF